MVVVRRLLQPETVNGTQASALAETTANHAFLVSSVPYVTPVRFLRGSVNMAALHASLESFRCVLRPDLCLESRAPSVRIAARPPSAVPAPSARSGVNWTQPVGQSNRHQLKQK